MAAAYQLPCCSHIHIDFVLGSYQRSLPPLNEVVITVSHRRRRSLFRPRLRISRPPFHRSPSLFYRTSIQTLTHDYCRRHLNLAPCCVDALLPLLLDTIFTVIEGFHGLPGIIPIGLQIFHRASSSTHHDLEEYERKALRESFEGAAPKPTPASMESIWKLVEDNMKTVGDDKEGWSCGNTTCTICLDHIETRRSSLEMPCSHVFHQDCIVGWLKSSHVCPLCRYQMPV